MVFLPGWASDYRIFSQIELEYNYLQLEEYFPQTIENDLRFELACLGVEKVSLFAYSLGAFKAVDFAHKNPDMIAELFLFALRRKYSVAEIAYVKESLIKNKLAYLNSFYKASFANRTNMSWFKQELLSDYIEKFELDYLLDTLDYLKECELSVDKLTSLPCCKIFHGAADSIAPVREIKKICRLTQQNLKVYDNVGHAVFLEQEITYE